MKKPFNLDDLAASPEEKKLILRALTDRKFREELERRAAAGEDALDEDALDEVVGGAGAVTGGTAVTKVQTVKVLGAVRTIELKSNLAGEVLCGGGGGCGGLA